jgi:argininosuccinate synthase
MSDLRTCRGAIVITPGAGATITPGMRFVVNASVAGNVTIVFRDGSTHVIAVPVGYTTYDFEVAGVNTAGTTATAIYSNLV